MGGHKKLELPSSTYEWPFDYSLPENIIESIGILEASVTCILKLLFHVADWPRISMLEISPSYPGT